MPSPLAIIVPAYKARFLARTLGSLAGQLSPSARLYVFDDASAAPLEEVVRATLAGSNHWEYRRFEQNLGRTELTRHYDRCIRATSEPWVWLFSDDDLADAACVSAFAAAEQTHGDRYDLYCFDSLGIDAEDRITGIHPRLPEHESWKEFAYAVFGGHHVVPQQAMIFARAAYDRVGGLVNFPAGWASDQATAMALAGAKGIRRIPGARIRFRDSGENISSAVDRPLASRKLQAAMQFVDWCFEQLKRMPDPEFPASDDVLRAQALDWFRQHLRALHTWYGPVESIATARFLARCGQESYLRALARMAALDVRILTGVLRGFAAKGVR